MKTIAAASDILEQAKDLVDVIFSASSDLPEDDYRRRAIRTTAHEASKKIEQAIGLLDQDGKPAQAGQVSAQLEPKPFGKVAQAAPPSLTHQQSVLFDMEPAICEAVHMARLASDAIETVISNIMDKTFRDEQETAHFAVSNLESRLIALKDLYYSAFQQGAGRKS